MKPSPPRSLYAFLPDWSREPDVAFFVPGKAAPGGSKRGFAFRRRDGSLGVNMIDAGKNNKEWRSCVAHAGHLAMLDDSPAGLEAPKSLLDGALSLQVTFVMQRPKGHFGAKGLKPKAPGCCTTKPDATKLLRALEDALTGVVWVDDNQIVQQLVRKVYGPTPGAWVMVWQEK